MNCIRLFKNLHESGEGVCISDASRKMKVKCSAYDLENLDSRRSINREFTFFKRFVRSDMVIPVGEEDLGERIFVVMNGVVLKSDLPKVGDRFLRLVLTDEISAEDLEGMMKI